MRKKRTPFSIQYYYVKLLPHQTVNYINIVYDGIKGNCNWSVVFYLPSSSWKTFFVLSCMKSMSLALTYRCVWQHTNAFGEGDRIYSKNCPLKCKKLNFPFVCWFCFCLASPTLSLARFWRFPSFSKWCSDGNVWLSHHHNHTELFVVVALVTNQNQTLTQMLKKARELCEMQRRNGHSDPNPSW